MNRRALFIHCNELEQFSYPAACPYNLARAGRTFASVKSMGLLQDDRVCRPEIAARSELELHHTPAYIDVLEKANRGVLESDGIEMGLGTPDCPVFDGLLDYARWAAGASLTGMRMLLNGSADVCFNPSGGYHHAFADHCGGFCYVNDIVLACMLAEKAGRRVLFLDIDVHHCDGVQAAFYRSGQIMTVSMHETGKTLFPGTGFEDEMGEGEGKGACLNIPLPVGTYDDAYLRAFRSIVVPAIQRFDPEIIVVECGMDGLAGDPLAHLHLTNNAHANIIDHVLSFGRPLLVTGGGGYNLRNAVRGWALIWSVIVGDDSHELMMGLGGVMMENTDWSAGLRDRMLVSHGGSHAAVNAEIDRLIEYHRVHSPA